MNDKGIYNKFNVSRVDGRSAPGEKHDGCEYFVLDITHDKHSMPALLAYAESCKADYPLLAADLRIKALATANAANEWALVPEVTLPGGHVEPSFYVGKYLCSRGPMDILQINATGTPLVDISYFDAVEACSDACFSLITETQYLAMAYDIAMTAANWSGGTVGEGTLKQGLHLGTVSEAQPGSYVSQNADEDRFFTLSNGELVCDAAGNAFSWVFDNIQGDERGVVKGEIPTTSPSLAVAPYPSLKKGMGWRPDGPAKWSGYALIRGGCWVSRGGAGVFGVDGDWPDDVGDDVGVRCTKQVP